MTDPTPCPKCGEDGECEDCYRGNHWKELTRYEDQDEPERRWADDC